MLAVLKRAGVVLTSVKLDPSVSFVAAYGGGSNPL